jgi:uncharacterized protein
MRRMGKPWIPAWAGMTALFLLAFLACASAFAQGVLPIPPLTARVIDQTGTLDAIQLKALEDKLAAFEQKKGSQMVFLLVPTTQPEDIASYANRVGNTWKIGRKAVGDGILLVVAKDDRKVRIEVAKTLEGAVPDLAAKIVIDEAITPRFRAGDFAGGLNAAADQLIARVTGEALPEPSAPSQAGIASGFDWGDLALMFFFGVPIAGTVLRGFLGKSLGLLATGGVFGAIAFLVTSSILVAGAAGFAALIFALLTGSRSFIHGGGAPGTWNSGGGGGGWSSGGSDGGGFSSGGGGDFGGGGASGDW